MAFTALRGPIGDPSGEMEITEDPDEEEDDDNDDTVENEDGDEDLLDMEEIDMVELCEGDPMTGE